MDQGASDLHFAGRGEREGNTTAATAAAPPPCWPICQFQTSASTIRTSPEKSFHPAPSPHQSALLLQAALPQACPSASSGPQTPSVRSAFAQRGSPGADAADTDQQKRMLGKPSSLGESIAGAATLKQSRGREAAPPASRENGKCFETACPPGRAQSHAAAGRAVGPLFVVDEPPSRNEPPPQSRRQQAVIPPFAFSLARRKRGRQMPLA